MNGIKSNYVCHTYTNCGDLKKALMKKFGLHTENFAYCHIYECITHKKARCIFIINY